MKGKVDGLVLKSLNITAIQAEKFFFLLMILDSSEITESIKLKWNLSPDVMMPFILDPGILRTQCLGNQNSGILNSKTQNSGTWFSL